MYNIPLTLNGDISKPIGVVSLDEEGMFYVQKHWDSLGLSICRNMTTGKIAEFSLVSEVRPSGPHDSEAKTMQEMYDREMERHERDI